MNYITFPVIIQMRQAITDLTKDQTQQLLTLQRKHLLDPSLSHKTHMYYRQLRKLNHHSNQPVSLQPLMTTAIVVAQQSQTLKDIAGRPISAVCLALNRILASKEDIQGIAAGLRLYIGGIKPHEQGLRQNLNGLLEQINYGINYMTKFQRAIAYFDFVELVGQAQGYLGIFKSFAWLLFLSTSQNLKTSSIQQTDYLLISVLYLMVRYGFDYLRPRCCPPLDSQKSIVSIILSQLFQIFQIDHPQLFKKVTASVDDYFEQLIATGVIKCYNHEHYDFLKPELVHHNYKRIDHHFEVTYNPHTVDLRVFLENRHRNLTPTKHNRVTPRPMGKGQKKQSHSFLSHKILTFEPEDNEQTQPFQPIQITKIDKLPGNVRLSPCYMRTPLICMRPSPCITIEYFMKQTIASHKNRGQLPQNQQEIVQVVQSILAEEINEDQVESKARLAYNYFLTLSNQYFEQEQYDEQDYNTIQCGSLALSLLFTLVNKNQPEDVFTYIKQTLSRIREDIAANAYELWLVSQYLKKNIKRLPNLMSQTITHLHDLIITQLLWQQNSCQEIEHHVGLDDPESIRTQNYHVILSEVVTFIKGAVISLLSTFSLPELTKNQIGSTLFLHLKSTVISATELPCNRNLHQIIMTQAYTVLRYWKVEGKLKFNDLIVRYLQSSGLSNDRLKKIVYEVPDNQGQLVDIIQFYSNVVKQYALENLINLTPEHLAQYSSIFKQELASPSPPKKTSNSRRIHTQVQQRPPSTHSSRRGCDSFAELARLGKKEAMFHEKEGERDQTRMRARPSFDKLDEKMTEKGKYGSVSRR